MKRACELIDTDDSASKRPTSEPALEPVPRSVPMPTSESAADRVKLHEAELRKKMEELCESVALFLLCEVWLELKSDMEETLMFM